MANNREMGWDVEKERRERERDFFLPLEKSMRHYLCSGFAKTLNWFLIKLVSLPHSLYRKKR